MAEAKALRFFWTKSSHGHPIWNVFVNVEDEDDGEKEVVVC